MHPQSQSHLITRDVTEGVLVHDERTGKVHVLNRAAARVLDLCDGTRDLAAIAATLAREGDVSQERAEGDVATVLADFRRLGLLT